MAAQWGQGSGLVQQYRLLPSSFIYVFIMSGSIPKAIIPTPSRQTPGHLTFFKMLDQIPRYMGRFQGQMPHWLGLKSQNFHTLSGIDERIVKEIFGSQSTAQGLKSRYGQKLRINPSHGSKIVMYLPWDFI